MSAQKSPQARPAVQLPRPLSTVEVTHVGDQTTLSYAGHDGFQRNGETVHYVSIGNQIIGGTLAELRDLTGELGLILAEAERDLLKPEVDLGHHLASDFYRRLA